MLDKSPPIAASFAAVDMEYDGVSPPAALSVVTRACDGKGIAPPLGGGDPFPPERLAARSFKEFDSSYKKGKGVDPAERTCARRASAFFCKRSPLQLLLRYLPFINMLRQYDWKRDLASDIVAGLSVSVLHTGQGLGYASLARLPPYYGIYVSFFHTIIYFFLGTSRHMSVGTYSLTSLVVGAVLDRELASVLAGGPGGASATAAAANSSYQFTTAGSSTPEATAASALAYATVAAANSSYQLTTAGSSTPEATVASALAYGTNATAAAIVAAAATASAALPSASATATAFGDWSVSATAAAATAMSSNLTGSGHVLSTASADAMSAAWQAEVDDVRVGIAATMSLLIGIVLCVLGALRFGVVMASYISPAYISAFTCAAAYHIASSQLKYVAFGRHHYIGNYSGPLKLYYLWRDFFVNFLHINYVCSLCFLVSMAILLAVKIGINKNPRFRHRLIVPVPVDLIIIVAFTIASYYFSIEELPTKSEGVEVIGYVPVGLPSPAVPSFYKWTNYLGDVFLISILIFLDNYTMANFFKEKYKYAIDENQEIIAPGVYHVVSSFFKCFPGAASPPRCFQQDAAGAKSQVSGLVSCVVLIIVLYVIAPYLYYLPFAVIAAIICASLKRLMLQVRDLKTYWRQDKIDFTGWLVTFLATLVLDIQLGMIIGVGFSVFTVALRVQLNRAYAVGRVDHDVYDDVSKYRLAGSKDRGDNCGDGCKKASHDVLVVRYGAPILFVNCGRFVKLVTKIVRSEREVSDDYVDAIVIDCTHVSFVDTAGVNALAKLRKQLSDDSVSLYFSGCSPQVRRALSAGDPLLYHSAFLTIRDVEEHLAVQKRVPRVDVSSDDTGKDHQS